MSALIDRYILSIKTDTMTNEDLFDKLQKCQPRYRPPGGRRTATPYTRKVEATHVEAARASGWSWEQIADALGVSRQSAHMKHGKEGDR